MDYKPTEPEKGISATVQFAAILGLFVPGMVVLGSYRSKRSPYVRYWSKVSMVWSIIAALLLGVGVAVWVGLGSSAVFFSIAVVHLVFSILGGMGALSDTSFGYLFVGDAFCLFEKACVWQEARLRLSSKAKKRMADELALLRPSEDDFDEAMK